MEGPLTVKDGGMRMAVNKIIPFSCIDGPGNRMVIFFQECNFHCGYCHNPETIHSCVHCGDCVEVCPSGALKRSEGHVIWEEKKCVGCDRCIHVCKNLSSPKTKNYSVDDLMERIIQSKAFLDGITVSGGECTLQSDFLIELFRRVKDETNLTCFVDTNGSLDLSNMTELVELTDQFMLDVKTVDEEEHRKLTGLSNQNVIKNLHYLLEQNKLYEVRTVLAPGLQHERTVSYVAGAIKDKCIYKLLKYRPLGVRKEGIELFGTEVSKKSYVEDMIRLANASGAVHAMEI